MKFGNIFILFFSFLKVPNAHLFWVGLQGLSEEETWRWDAKSKLCFSHTYLTKLEANNSAKYEVQKKKKETEKHVHIT